ncbi:type II/IV secretion system protein [bacterium]|nr:type II/IV secretion system protein [bacterium]
MHFVLEYLLNKGKISKALAEKIQKESDVLEKKIEEILVEREISSEDEIAKIKSEILGVPYRFLKKKEKIPSEILNLIPEEVSKKYQVIALGKKDDVLEVGMVYPKDEKAQDILRFIARKLNLDIKIYVVRRKDLEIAWRGYELFDKEISEVFEELRRQGRKFRPLHRIISLEEATGVLTEEAPIIKLVSVFLKYGVRYQASDIHIEPLKTKIRVRYRIDGTLRTVAYLPLEILPPIISRIKILSNLKIDETRIPQDGRFSTIIDGKEIDFRVSTFPTAVGEKTALRILDPEVGLKKFEELGVILTNRLIIERAIKKPFGMILVTGPTGCGKTTTLYALTQKLKSEEKNIVTLEDPIEYFIEGLNQSQIKPEIGYSFASGLRQILRQDPDIIMVGEIRDEETAALAVHAALTGHLVLSTLHTNNAIGVIPRLVDMGVPIYLLPSSLAVMIAQRLVPKICPFCKEKVKPDPETEKIIDESIESLPEKLKNRIKIEKPYFVWKGKGCPKCHYRGISGRIAIFEAFEMTDNLAKIISKGIDEEKILEETKRQGMLTMRQDGILKALKGIVPIEIILRETE